MPRYRLNYCEVLEFEGQTAGEVVPFIAVSHMMGAIDRDWETNSRTSQ